MIDQIGNGLWVLDQSSTIFGLELHRIMTVVRMEDKTLALHAPFRLTPKLVEEIRSIGEPSIVIAPTSFHYRAAIDAMNFFPQAKLLYAPFIGGQRPEAFDYVRNKQALDAEAFHMLAPTLEALPIKGIPFLNECLFYHPASASLLASNLFTFAPTVGGLMAKILSWILGIDRGKLSLSRMTRWCVRDKEIFNQSLARAKLWPTKRYILSQSAIVERNPLIDLKLLAL